MVVVVALMKPGQVSAQQVAAADTSFATASTFLTDPALPAFPGKDTSFSVKPNPRQPYWRLSLDPGPALT